MRHRSRPLGFVLVCLPPLVTACGIPLGDIRSAAESGDVERAVRLAQGELEGFRAAAEGTLSRLAAQASTRPALREALDAAPVSATSLLEAWAAEDSAVDLPSRTFARARLAELEGGAWQDELRAVRAADDPTVRAFAVRGLAAAGLSAGELLEALADPAPEVTRVASAALATLSRGDGGLPETLLPALREAFAAAADPSTRARLAGTLDPDHPADLQALVAALEAPAPAVRLAAAAALGASSAPAAVPELLALLEGELRPAGLALAQSLGRHGRADLAEAYLARVLQQTPRDDPLRVGVLVGLDPAAADSDVLLREAVANGGPQELVAACERLLAAEDDAGCRGRLRELAAAARPFDAALAATEVLFEDGDPPAAAWLRSYVVQAEPGVRRSVMAVAAARRFDDGLISIGLADPDPGVAAAAAVAAMRVPDPLARPGVAP